MIINLKFQSGLPQEASVEETAHFAQFLDSASIHKPAFPMIVW